MRVELLFGFLGSGKTTLARRILEQWGKKERIALIVNEFGDVGVDGTILQGKDLDLIELNSGCLCCSLKGELLNAVEELTQRQGIQHILVEATGIASPEEMIENLAPESFAKDITLGPLTTVVDAAKYLKIKDMLGPFYESQIVNSDLIVLNKIDLSDAANLDKVKNAVRELNPRARIRFAERCDVNIAEIMEGPETTLIGQDRHHAHGSTDAHHEGHVHGAHEDHAHAPADSFVVDLSAALSRSSLEEFFKKAPPGLWRAKGFVKLGDCFALIQYAMGDLEISDSQPRNRYYLVFIGSDLDQQAISERLRSYCEEPAR
jgi:G3E family GTPase